jgi:hypothetical protein
VRHNKTREGKMRLISGQACRLGQDLREKHQKTTTKNASVSVQPQTADLLTPTDLHPSIAVLGVVGEHVETLWCLDNAKAVVSLQFR